MVLKSEKATSTVSLLMPVFNAESTLSATLESVFSQTRRPEQIIAIDDGSTDNSAALLNSWRGRGLEVYRQSNQGLAATLNRGLALARGDYVARLDSDDLALPHRLERQVAYLDAHPEIALLGTSAQIWVGDEPSDRHHHHPTEPQRLKLDLLLDNPFVHSSVMFRLNIVRALGGYSEEARPYPEDYELWSRLSRGHGVANLSEVLTVYREMPTSITRSSSHIISDHVTEIATANLMSTLADVASPAECKALAHLYHGKAVGSLLQAPRLLKLWQLAAYRIGGRPVGWSPEFHEGYARVRKHLLGQLLRKRLPTSIVNVIRASRDRIRQGG